LRPGGGGAPEVVAVAAILIVAGATLHLMGQPWWCAQGDLVPWASDINSPHNSQHLVDAYTLTHLLHGIALYAVLRALAGGRLAQRHRFIITIALEAAWEVFENTDLVIGRYREATISLAYFGDSIVNSLGDLTACAIGYGAAMALPAWGSAATFAGVEIFLLLWIRDSLLLNIIMLVRPLEAIKTWQTGG